MMKLLTSFIIAVSCSFLYAQDGLSFNSKFGKIEFTIAPNEFYTEYNLKDTLEIERLMTSGSFYIGINSAIIHRSGLAGNFDSNKRQLIQENDIDFLRIEPILLFADGTKQIAKGEINLRIKNGYHIEDVQAKFSYRRIS